jgi:hypothetical protein
MQSNAAHAHIPDMDKKGDQRHRRHPSRHKKHSSRRHRQDQRREHEFATSFLTGWTGAKEAVSAQIRTKPVQSGFIALGIGYMLTRFFRR